MAVISVLSIDEERSQQITGTTKAFSHFLKAHKIFAPADRQKALNFMSLCKTDLCVCDYNARHALAGHLVTLRNPAIKKIPTVLVCYDPIEKLYSSSETSLPHINVVGQIGFLAQDIGRVWSHVAKVITQVEKNNNGTRICTPHDFAQAFKQTPILGGEWVSSTGRVLDQAEDGLKPISQSLLKKYCL